MPQQTPLHPRTSALAASLAWKEWAGYHAVKRYGSCLDPEYHAIRQRAGMLDVSPLVKVNVEGPQAAEYLAYVWTRDARRMKVGRVTYGCFTDDAGRVIDDGTLTRWSSERFRMTSTEFWSAWLLDLAEGFEVELTDETDAVAALAVQGPCARRVVSAALGEPSAELRFFGATTARLGDLEVEVTRTGYTGDLGYELWVPADGACALWDALARAGEPCGLTPVGLDALDVTRMEAGFVLGGVDYTSAKRAFTPAQTTSPFELGLAWAVHLEREPFVGQAALAAEALAGSPKALVGLAVDWDATVALFDAEGLPPHLPEGGWRESIPLYRGAQQVGYATSGSWSPLCKRNLALATVERAWSAVGTELEFEVTVEHRRRTVPARVIPRPAFDPERKRA